MNAIDLFAGAGGFTTGAALAGCRVLYAANHWPTAVEWHAANHPGTVHACQDLQQADFRTAPAHDLLLASPACQGHSPARGKDQPHHDAQRATAWAVVTCAEVHRLPVHPPMTRRHPSEASHAQAPGVPMPGRTARPSPSRRG